MIDSFPLLVTAMAYYFMGGIMLYAAFRLWYMHPVQRAPKMAVHLTPEGSNLVLKRWPLVYLFGAFFISCALEHSLHFFHDLGYVSRATLNGVAIAEAVIAVVAALYVLWITAQWGVSRWGR